MRRGKVTRTVTFQKTCQAFLDDANRILTSKFVLISRASSSKATETSRLNAPMAKGLRASSKKANKSKLREKVFGPVEEARNQRLAARGAELLALATSSKEGVTNDTIMQEQEAESEISLSQLLGTRLTILVLPASANARNPSGGQPDKSQGTLPVS